ncbi:hypothetical protein [Microbacterium sp. VKM Ac-2923]|uniref:hypothetical protein n=1 Tax=Microbacterium sp. VKM Ac-2923 TaxID=2929476 RepID=UPI001FB24535|nr:hypothetical protein [Microbacterium sp. VKM Ac-2923]MCJ1707291.1 hypothetical protein [Microbacterium sp. VKM Ac-2923]
MPTSTARLFATATVVVAGLALAGCTGGEDDVAPPTTPAPTSAPTTSTPDAWAGTFDDVVSAAEVGEYVWQSWGTFGDPGGVAPFRNENRTVEPGVYDVTLRCAGPQTVTASLWTATGTAIGDPVPFSCGAVTALPVEVADRGLRIDLDSDREPGAFLIQVKRVGD